jgi:hypothetical protein
MLVDDTLGEIEFKYILLEENIFISAVCSKSIDEDVFLLSQAVGPANRLLIMDRVPCQIVKNNAVCRCNV